MTLSSSLSWSAIAVHRSLSIDVGKSCLILRYVESVFKDNHEPTMGVEFASKII